MRMRTAKLLSCLALLCSSSVAAGATEVGVIAFPVPPVGPYAITSGPDGAMWFTEVHAGGNIGRITRDGAVIEFAVGGGGYGITAGPDGAIWFTQQEAQQIGRITTDGT